jgi:hypothetical protein
MWGFEFDRAQADALPSMAHRHAAICWARMPECRSSQGWLSDGHGVSHAD